MTRGYRHFGLFLFLAVSVAVWWRPLTANLRLAISSDAHTYVLLVLPISIALMFVETDERPSKPASGLVWGGVLLAIAISGRAATGWNAWHLSSSANLALSIAALVLFWIASAICCFGWRAIETNLFPICFLLLFVPLPDQAVIWMTFLLQQQSASAADLVFRIAAVPVTRDGIILSIPGLMIEVGKECSSIRSSTMLIVTTILLAHLFLKSWWRKILLVATSLPLSVAKNALRIFVIAELGTRVDRGYLNGWLHHQGGFIYLGIALLSEVVLLWILRWNEAEANEVSSRRRDAVLQR